MSAKFPFDFPASGKKNAPGLTTGLSRGNPQIEHLC